MSIRLSNYTRYDYWRGRGTAAFQGQLATCG